MNRTAFATLALAFGVAACGGTPNTPDGSTVNSPGSPSSPPPTIVQAGVTISIPKAARSRRVRYVSPRTQSVAIGLASVDGTGVSNAKAVTIDVGPRAPGCKATATATVCSGFVDAVAGQDVFNVTTFAGPSGAGPVLSAGTVEAAVTGSSGNVAVSRLALTLDGVIAALRLTLTPGKSALGKPARADVVVTALDAAGSTIVGPSDYFAPIAVSIQGDAANAFALHSGAASGSRIAVARPGPPLALLYDGSTSASSITLLASAPGTGSPSASTTFTLRGTRPPPSAGDTYVLNAGTQNGLGATVTVYSPTAKGNAAPLRTLQLDPKLYAVSIALDAQQRVYVGYYDTPIGANIANGTPDAGNVIDVYAAGASGAAAPVATIAADTKSGSTIYPAAMAFDAAGELITYGATRIDGNGGSDAVVIYASGASGTIAPADAWGFTSPYLNSPGPTGLALDAAGNFYVAGTLKTSALGPQSGVFVALAADRSNASANASRTLPWDSGSQLTPGLASAIALDASGEIYIANVTHASGSPCQAQVSVYSAGSSGGTTDIPPLRTASIAGFDTSNPSCASPGNFQGAHFPALDVFASLVYAGDAFNNALATYPIASAGSVKPASVVTGSAAELNDPIAIAVAPSSDPTVSARGSHERNSSQREPR